MILSILFNLGVIPKILHITWKDSLNLTQNSNLIIQNGIVQFKKLNPTWKIELSDDTELEQYLKTHLSHLDYRLISLKHAAEKSDLWRLMKMCHTGGIYMDIDRLANIRVEKFIKNTTKMILPQFYGFSLPGNLINFSQDIMGTAPGNKIFCEAVKENVKRRRNKNTRMDKSTPREIYELGPNLYTEMVSSLLFGIKFIEYPSNRIKDEVQMQLHKYRHIVSTYQEIIPFHTIIYRGSRTSTEWYDRAKKELKGKTYTSWNE